MSMSDPIAAQIARLSPSQREQLLKRMQFAGLSRPNAAISPRDRTTNMLPLSPMQRQLWFFDQFDQAMSLYTICRACSITGPLDREALRKSLNEIVRRHEALRTTIAMVDEQPVQVIASELTLELPLDDLEALPHEVREQTAKALALQEARQPFVLDQGPLVRARLLRLDTDHHTLLLTFHHIIFDGWSLQIFLRELSTFYETFSHEQEPHVPDATLQYGDYVLWQEKHLQSEEMQQHLAYWTASLAHAPALLELPLDRPYTQLRQMSGASLILDYPSSLLTALKEFSQKQGVTLFMTLLTGFYALLQRYSGSADIVIGTNVAQRDRKELENTIGFFANTLALRLNENDNPTINALLQRVKQNTLDAFTHQETPFEEVITALQPERQLNVPPLFQVMFILQQSSPTSLPLGEASGSLSVVDPGVAPFPLTISLEEGKAGLTVGIQYSTELFEQATIERLHANYRCLLEAMVANPAQQVATLNALSSDERARILDLSSIHNQWQDRFVNIVDQFETQAGCTPDALALITNEQQLTYRELDQQANHFASLLQKHGVGAESLVALLLPRSERLLITLLAILKAGGTYLPLDVETPPERITLLLESSRPHLIVTEHALIQELPVMWAECSLYWDDPQLQKDLAAAASTVPTRSLHPEQLAMLIYTSGSTGQPKGVGITHRALAAHSSAFSKRIQLCAQDRVLHFASISFDVASEEIFPTLLAGACIVLWQDRHVLDLLEFQRFIEQRELTVLNLPVSYWQAWLDELIHHAMPVPETLRCLLIGSEVVYSHDVARWLSLIQGRKLLSFNAYGVTETTITNTLQSLPKLREYPRTIAPIGTPLSHVEVYVLDQQLQLVPIGVAGELYIGGPSLSRGYIGQPDMTAERFIPHVFSSRPGERLYRTGDRVRWLSDGTLEYLERADQQIKIRGFRIEPGEIESILLRQDDVKEAVIWKYTAEDERDTRLVAYIVWQDQVARHDQQLDILYRALQDRLPDYMLPGAFVELPSIAKLPSGKTNYQLLPPPTPASGKGEQHLFGHDRPRTIVEDMLASLWCELLGCADIGNDANFFRLGGHSLMATRLVARLREALNIDIPLRLVFEFPTFAAFAEQLAQRQNMQQGIQIPPLTVQERPEHIPLSFAQQRFWFLDQLQSQSAVYSLSLTLWLRGSLNILALRSALEEVLRRHEALRMLFVHYDAEPELIMQTAPTYAFDVVDLTTLPVSEREAYALQLATNEVQRPFDLAQGPLLRIHLWQINEKVHLFTLALHHIIADGWSLEILLQELMQAYNEYALQQTQSQPALPEVSYVDYVLWQRSKACEVAFARQLEYWQQQLAGVPKLLNLPTDKPRPATPTGGGRHLSFLLSPTLTHQIKALGQRKNATTFMVLLAAFHALLARYSGQDDILVGIPVSNRHHPHIERLVGLFINTLVIHADLSANPTFEDLLQQIRHRTLEAFTYQDVPFERIVEALQIERTMSYSPLFQVMFAFQETAEINLPFAHLEVERQEIEYGTAKFDLSLDMAETAEGLRGRLEYRTDLFHEERMRNFIAHYETLLEALVSQPQAPITSHMLLSARQQDMILSRWNATQYNYPDQGLIHQRIEMQAQLRPDATALVHETRKWTYAQLNQQANQLAHKLRRCGVGPEAVVGVYMERSPEAVIAFLAILKAGGAYLPIDSSYPLERTRFVLDDARIRLLLTQPHLQSHLAPLSDCLEILVVDGSITWEEEYREALATRIVPENICYIIYTSGSTGRPKGVQITHASLLNIINWYLHTFQITEEDRLSQFSSIAFDAMVMEVWACLVAGATLFIPNAETRLVAQWLQAWLFKNAITLAILPTPIAEQMVRLSWPTQQGSLRAVLTGGDNLHYEKEHPLPFAFFNGYGPTETTVAATIGLIQSPERPFTSLTIGRPLLNYQTYILDRYQQPVPVGVPGELYIGGKGIGRGYLGAPDLTAERFLPDSFASIPGSRLYRTGDLVRYRDDGEIEFLGRVDAQVKIRGFRIELGEIEHVLQEHPEVVHCAVSTHTSARGEPYLVAYVVASQEIQEELKTYLRQKLPEYMIPTTFLFLDALPLTSHGKVDRAHLPLPALESAETYSEPEDEIERQLADIWQNLLNLSQVGTHQNFFTIGGHSLLATQLLVRIQEQFHIHIPLQTIFERPTIAELANAIKHIQPTQQPVANSERTRTGHHLESLLARLDQLTEEEAADLLSLDEPDLDEADL